MTTQKLLQQKTKLKKNWLDSLRPGGHTPPPVFFNTCFDKKQLKTLIAWFLQHYGEKITVDLLETFKEIGFHHATQAGVSLGLDDLLIPPQKPQLISKALGTLEALTQAASKGTVTSVESSQRLIDTWNQTSEVLRQSAVQNFRGQNPVNPVFMMAFSGARGNISQVRQLVGMRGLMADPQGTILEFPIQSNFREGLTISEYVISCYGARKGLVDTALRTATSGYLTRRLVDAAQHVVILQRDCKSARGITLSGPHLEQRLFGRVLAAEMLLDAQTTLQKNTLISARVAKQLAAKYTEVRVRSPLTCNTEKSVCQLCYGLDLAQGSLVSVGEAVGVIAAQSIGEPGTQLTMRTFHTGGVGVFSEAAMESFVAPFEGKVYLSEVLPGLFVRTPHGQIVYLLKHKESLSPNKEVFLRLLSAQSKDSYEILSTSIPSGSLLWVKQGQPVKAGDLLLQASRIKTSKQTLPESSHPVATPISGEMYFESMVVRYEEKERPWNATPAQRKEDASAPPIRTLVRLGTFWVLSSFLQNLHSVASSFFLKGDLVSSDTPLIQYNLVAPHRGKLKLCNSQLLLQRPIMHVKASQVWYMGTSYYFMQKEALVVSTPTQRSHTVTWYPRGTPLNSLTLGLWSVVPRDLPRQPLQSPAGGQVVSSPGVFFTEHWVGRSPTVIPEHFACILQSGARPGRFQLYRSSHGLWKQRSRRGSAFWKQARGAEGRGTPHSSFLKNTLGSSLLPSYAEHCLLHKAREWFYVPQHTLPWTVQSQETGILLEPGKSFERVVFENCVVSIQLLKADRVCFLRPARRPEKSVVTRLLARQREGCSLKGSAFFPQQQRLEFSFYRKNTASLRLEFQLKRKKHMAHLLSFQKTLSFRLPGKRELTQSWLAQTPPEDRLSLRSPLRTKQVASSWEGRRPPYSVSLPVPTISYWGSPHRMVKLQFQPTDSGEMSTAVSGSSALWSSFQEPAASLTFTLLTSTRLHLHPWSPFSFQTFPSGWVLPTVPLSRAFAKSQALGEFRAIRKKKDHLRLSVLRKADLVAFDLQGAPLTAGALLGPGMLRWGDEFLPGCGVSENGYIVKVSKNRLVLRKGVPFLGSSRGVIHVFQGDFVQKNDLLITLKSRRLQTEDIVQGIPKIEQLFEARETQGGEALVNSTQIQLRRAFTYALRSAPLPVAVLQSIYAIQLFLVENIVEAYSNQGVTIAEKHVEIIVRQMTARVRILSGGDTGVVPGEIVQLKWMERVNRHFKRLGSREARYEPLVLGITKSVLQSESFLVAASFQEVSRVLVKSALSKKTDFLRGLHENVILGQLLPAGTGLILRKPLKDAVSSSSEPGKLSGAPRS